MEKERSNFEVFLTIFLFIVSQVSDILFISASLWLVFMGSYLLWNYAHNAVMVLLFLSWVVPVSMVGRGWLRFYWNNVFKNDTIEKKDVV